MTAGLNFAQRQFNVYYQPVIKRRQISPRPPRFVSPKAKCEGALNKLRTPKFQMNQALQQKMATDASQTSTCRLPGFDQGTFQKRLELLHEIEKQSPQRLRVKNYL